MQNAKVMKLKRKDKEKFINKQCQHVKKNFIANSLKYLYQGVRRLIKKFNPRVNAVKDEDGDVNQRWKKIVL